MTAGALCQNHPDRDAIGVCVKCRSRVCGECTTKVDGINYCVTCLATLAENTAPSTRSLGSRDLPRPIAVVSAVGWFGTLSLLAWGLLEVVFGGA